MKGIRVSVVTDPTTSGNRPAALRSALGGAGEVVALADAGGGLAEVVGDAADGAFEVLAVDGSAGLVAEAAAALEALGPRGAGLRLLPLPGEAMGPLCSDLGIRGSGEDVLSRLEALHRKGSGLRRRPPKNAWRRTLRVVASSEAAPRFGFVLALGRMVELMERSAGGGAARSALGLARTLAKGARDMLPTGGSADTSRRPARVALDHEAFADELGYIACTTLSRVHVGLAGFDGPVEQGERFHVLRADFNAMMTLGARAMLPTPGKKSRESYQRLSGRSLDVDLDQDALLDGVRIEARGPYALGVRPGPAAPMVVV